MAKTKMIKYGVQNVKASFKDELGEYKAPEDVAYARSFAEESDFNEIKIYGDGQVIAVLPDDKGKTGTLSVTNLEKEYEIACGRMMEIDGGVAQIQQKASIEHALYYEVLANENGATKTIKNWVFGVTSGRASETYTQTEDDPNISSFDYPLTIIGTELISSTGSAVHKDANGNTTRVWKLTCYPGETGYETFGDAVPIPKAKSAA